MLMEMTVPSTSSFDQPGACLADRSPAHEPQEHRAGSESLFTCFWGLRGQTMRVAKKGTLPQGGPEGFRAREARGRCVFCRANLSSRGRLRGAEQLVTSLKRGPRRSCRESPPKPPYQLFQLFPPTVPHPGCAEPAKTPKFPGTDLKLYFKWQKQGGEQCVQPRAMGAGTDKEIQVHILICWHKHLINPGNTRN